MMKSIQKILIAIVLFVMPVVASAFSQTFSNGNGGWVNIPVGVTTVTFNAQGGNGGQSVPYWGGFYYCVYGSGGGGGAFAYSGTAANPNLILYVGGGGGGGGGDGNTNACGVGGFGGTTALGNGAGTGGSVVGSGFSFPGGSGGVGFGGNGGRSFGLGGTGGTGGPNWQIGALSTNGQNGSHFNPSGVAGCGGYSNGNGGNTGCGGNSNAGGGGGGYGAGGGGGAAGNMGAGGGSMGGGGGGGSYAHPGLSAPSLSGRSILLSDIGSPSQIYLGTGTGGGGTYPGIGGNITISWVDPGTINVTSNISGASWVITGPTTIIGSGASQSTASSPGTYTITWNPVAGYTTPVSQAFTLTPGGTINFNGVYTVIPVLPTVTTPTFSGVTSTGATLGANVTSLGSPATITRGTCWGTTPAPTTNCVAEGGTTTGTFSHARTGMTSGVTYYYRGYATNSTGTGYSIDGIFTTASAPDLTASVVTPQTALMGAPATFSATISNTGAPTGATFTDLFEISQVNNPPLFTDLYAKVATTSIALAAPGSNLAWTTYTFPTAGIWYVRACADTNTVNSGTITESNEGNNCSPTWTSVLVLDPASISFNGAGCVLPSGGGSCNVTSWWNVALPGVETVDIEVKGLGYAKVFKKLPVNSTTLTKALDKTKNLATLFTAKPISVPQSSALQVPVSTAGSLNLSLQRSLDHFVLASLPPVVSCNSNEVLVGGVCTTLCANGTINPPSCTQCPDGQAYFSGSCVPCVGGCGGAPAGSTSVPNGSLFCSNGAPLPPLCATSCSLPWGGSIGNNLSVTAYQSSSVTAPTTCASVTQTRTCTAGTLSGSYLYQSCTEKALKLKYQQF